MDIMQIPVNSMRLPGTILLRIVNNALLLIIAFFIMVDGFALADYYLYGNWYQFDGNSSGWRYASTTSFMLTLLVETLVGASGILAGSLFPTERAAMWFRLAVVVLLGFMAFTSLTA